jgi:prevent-host-death family protein
MPTVTAVEARARFGQLLDRVARGEEIVITRHEKPIARILPEGRPALRQVPEAVNALQALRREMERRNFKPLSDKEVRRAVEQGRA